MRVVVVDHVARLSGGEIALARVMPELARAVDVTVVLGEDGPLVSMLRSAGAEVRVLTLPAAVRDRRRDMAGVRVVGDVLRTLAYVFRLRRLLREVHADVVHTNSLKASVYGGLAGRLARVPVLWHVRDRIAADYLPRRVVVVVRLLARLLPSAIVANSAATLATLPRRRLSSVVPDCVERVAADRPVACRDALVFGVVGRLAPWKGQHVFLRAFAAAFGGSATCGRLIGSAMFGEDAYEAELRSLVVSLGLADQVEMRGFREDVQAEYADLDVLVHCSITPEPFGQVVLEGMAAGLPVIAAAAGGPTEMITPGVDGVLVPPGDVEGLARDMQTLSVDADLRERLGRAALTKAALYTPERTARGILEVYDRCSGLQAAKSVSGLGAS